MCACIDKNKNFELKTCGAAASTRTTCSVLLCLVKVHITHVQNTHVNCSVQTYQTCACSCVCTCACPHTAYHIRHTNTPTHPPTHPHTHTHCTSTASVHPKQTQQARTVIHTIDTQRNSFVCLGPYAVASKCLTKEESSSFVYNAAHNC